MTQNIREDCPDWKKDSSIMIKELLDLGYLEGDCGCCMYYDPISKEWCKDRGGETK